MRKAMLVTTAALVIPVTLGAAQQAVVPVMLAATLLAPAAGYFYGGRSMRGLLGIDVRLGGIGLARAAGATVRSSEPRGCVGWYLAGAAIVLTSTINDLVMVDNAVRDHNARRSSRVGLAPYVEPSGGAGVVLTVRH